MAVWLLVYGALLPGRSPTPSRRDTVAAAAALTLLPAAGDAASSASAATASSLRASWTATDGFSEKDFIAFDESAYAAMRDDEGRTPLFAEAIRKRLAGRKGELTVLDVGTGPFALLSLLAARAGAKKVYAVEASKEAARRARACVAAAKDVPAGVIEVIDGFSTEVTLPEKVDLLLAEIVGSVASEEGCYATIRDAQKRHLKQPFDAASYIPAGCQTLAAPASYALHYALGPPQFDWSKLGEPVRLNCRDETAQLLAEPQVLEDIRFSSPELPTRTTASLNFVVSPERLKASEAVFFDELQREKVPPAEAAPLAAAVSRSFSGLAMWPRVLLDGELECLSRGEGGAPRKSHWQTVLPLMAARPAVDLGPGDTIRVDASVDLGGGAVAAPARYSLQAEILKAAPR